MQRRAPGRGDAEEGTGHQGSLPVGGESTVWRRWIERNRVEMNRAAAAAAVVSRRWGSRREMRVREVQDVCAVSFVFS
jgi:hypothetical protein